MNFCSECGHNDLQFSIPTGDNRPRHHCAQCGSIFYQNPRIIAGTLAYYEDKIVLCKRAIEPRYGKWTLPAGFLENGESIEQGAIRESHEEACLKLETKQLYCVYNLLHINQVYIFYLAEVIDGQHGAGEESLETGLFDEASIPWQELAFPTMTKTLQHYLNDRKAQHYPLHIEDISWPAKSK